MLNPLTDLFLLNMLFVQFTDIRSLVLSLSSLKIPSNIIFLLVALLRRVGNLEGRIPKPSTLDLILIFLSLIGITLVFKEII